MINLGTDGPAENLLQLKIEGITEGQYIVATDFKIILNVDEMKVDLCVSPPLPGTGWLPAKQTLPDPETRITAIGPAKKYRPGDTVELSVDLKNNDSRNNPAHNGILTLTIENNSYEGAISTDVKTALVSIKGGKTETLDTNFMGMGVDTFHGLKKYLTRVHKYKVHEIGSETDFNLANFDLVNQYPEDIFYFVYDWRMDNSSHTDALQEFISKIVDGEYLNIKFEMMTEGGIIKTYLFFDIPLNLNGNGAIDIDLTNMNTDPVLRL